jgi:hypothetical protein
LLTEASGWKRTWEKVAFEPGSISRHYVAIPDNATFCVFRMTDPVGEKTGRFVLHAVHVKSDESHQVREFEKTFSITVGGPPQEFYFQVISNRRMILTR